MAYDEHSNDGPAGPIASQQWWANVGRRCGAPDSRDKAVVTIGNYAYDWHDGTGDPENVEEAWVDAGDSDKPGRFSTARPATARSPTMTRQGIRHVVWLLDAASAFNELTVLDRAGLGEFALWRLGSEDPGLWSIFGRTTDVAAQCHRSHASAGRDQRRHRRHLARSFGSRPCRRPGERQADDGASNGCCRTSTSCACPGRSRSLARATGRAQSR